MCLSVAVRRPGDVLDRGREDGFDWVIMHNGFGYRCGYVHLPSFHPWDLVDWTNEPLNSIEVHGGVDYSEADLRCGYGCEGWWIGFHCAHSWDGRDYTLLKPTFALSLCLVELEFPRLIQDRPVRDSAYVRRECLRLIDQAMVAEGRDSH